MTTARRGTSSRARPTAWRTLRIDRMSDVVATGHRVEIVDPPDPVAFVQTAITTAPYRHQARIELAAPIADVAAPSPTTVGHARAGRRADDDPHHGRRRRRLARLPPRLARLPVRVLEPTPSANGLREIAD